MQRSHRSSRPAWGSVGTIGLLGALALGVAVAPAAVAGASGPSASEKAQAKAAFIVHSDLPKGWTSTKNTNSGGGIGTGDPAADQQLASCLGVPVSLIQANPPQITGPEFNSPGNQTYNVADAVQVFPSRKEASSTLAALAGPKVSSCFQAIASGPLKAKIASGAPPGMTFGTVTVTALPARSLPAHSAGITAAIPVTQKGVSLTVYTTQVMTVKGQLASELQFLGGGEQFPTALQKHLVALAASRLKG